MDIILLAVISGFLLGFLVMLPYLSRIYEIGLFAYTNARIRALYPGILGDKIKELVKYETLDDIINSLKETEYGKVFGDDIQEHIEEIEKPPEIIDRGLVRLLQYNYNKIYRILPQGYRGDFTFIRRYFDILNLKMILRYIYSGKKKGGDIETCSGDIPEIVLNQLLSSETVSEFIQKIPFSDLRAEMERNLDVIQSENGLFYAELIIDKYYFNKSLKGIKSPQIKKFFQRYVDMINVITLFRCFDLDESEKKGLLIDNGYELTTEFLKNAVKQTEIDFLVSVFENTTYSEVLLEALEKYREKKDLYLFEKAARLAFLYNVRKKILEDPFSHELSVAFLFEKEIDMLNLRALFLGKISNFTSEEIEYMMVI